MMMNSRTEAAIPNNSDSAACPTCNGVGLIGTTDGGTRYSAIPRCGARAWRSRD